ncbi:MAG: DEAD/DEAH box helicase [Crenarchaeota archaeon]|nr:DEAD/DEAH box helicase [Thermoproteota archaeon]
MIEPIDRFELPPVILRGLRERGIERFTPPQAEAIRRGLLKGRNILVATPTASGKTLIAEIAMVNAVLRGCIGIYATPLKALANEKFEEFRFWEKYGVRVGISTGDYEEPGEELGRYDIIVATYERLDSILRNKPSWLKRVGTVVIDEMHNINDGDRGPIVELIATRALYLGKQVVGLSATIGNPEALAKWLGAELVRCEWRPVRLVEGYFDRFRREIVFSDGRVEEVEADVVTHSVSKAMNEDYQLLIFRQSRKHAEGMAEKVAPIVERFLEPGEKRELEKLVAELRASTSSRIEFESLKPLIERGVAFHHAGLSLGARKVVERGFRQRLIKVIAATPTLAAGINLPARRVLIYTKRFENGQWVRIPVAEYKQMAGRAGRPGLDPYGEAVIVDADPRTARAYVEGQPESVESRLWSERALRIHVLATVVSGYARTYTEILSFFSKTFGASGARIFLAQKLILETLSSLERMRMVLRSGGSLEPTPLGEAVSRLYIDPLTAHVVLKYLEFEGSRELSELYYLTLIAMTPDFERVRVVRYRQLEEEAEALASEGEIPPPPPEVGLGDAVGWSSWLRAYKIARILHAWISEVEEDSIVESFGIGVGDLASIVDTATWLTHAAARVCRVAGLDDHSSRLERLAKRVEYGVREDAIELVAIRGIGRARARVLINAGIRSVEQLASESVARIARLPLFGEKIARQVIEAARELLRSRRGR